MAKIVNLGKVLISFKGEYNPSTQYKTTDIVSYQGSSYIAILDSLGVVPTNTTNWAVVAKKGSDGATGPQGIQGPQGVPGKDGQRGERGVSGFTYTPNVNAQGDLTWTNNGNQPNPPMVNIKGKQGIQGPTGPTGPIGPIGPSNTIKIGTVTKGDVASATITGTAPNQVLNLVLPKGDKGDIGPQGIPGQAGVFDTSMSDTSTNGAQNKVIKAYVDSNIKTVNDSIQSVNNKLFNKDYNGLSNKPRINNFELTGNKTLSELGIQPAEYGKGLSQNNYTTAEKNKVAKIDVLETKTATEVVNGMTLTLTFNRVNRMCAFQLNCKGTYPGYDQDFTVNANFNLANKGIPASFYPLIEASGVLGMGNQFTINPNGTFTFAYSVFGMEGAFNFNLGATYITKE